MSKAIAIRQSAEVLDSETLNKLVMSGNLAGLKPDEQRAYYIYRCKLLDLDPATQPFDLITLQGKLTLYAKKECASQLASKRNLSATIVSQGVQGELYVVQARCKGGDGRETDDLGAVSIKGKSGDDLCNAMMKAATKAKRRAILTHCGLGMLDESELETVRNGWGQSGSREAQQAVAAEKLAEMRASDPTVTERDYTMDEHGAMVDLEEDPMPAPTPAPSASPTAKETPATPIIGARPAANPRTGAYLYPEQADHLKLFAKAKKAIGEEAYYRCLRCYKLEKSTQITKEADGAEILQAMRDIAQAQAKQRQLKSDQAKAEMDANSLICSRPDSGCDMPIGNQIATYVKALKWSTESANAKIEMHRKAGEDWETIMLRLRELVEREGK